MLNIVSSVLSKRAILAFRSLQNHVKNIPNCLISKHGLVMGAAKPALAVIKSLNFANPSWLSLKPLSNPLLHAADVQKLKKGMRAVSRDLCVTEQVLTHTLALQHCRQCPRSLVVVEMFAPIVQRILKHTVVRI